MGISLMKAKYMVTASFPDIRYEYRDTYPVSFNFHSLGGPASGYSQQLQVEVRDGVSATNGNEIITAGSAQVAPGAKAGFSMSQNG